VLSGIMFLLDAGWKNCRSYYIKPARFLPRWSVGSF